MPMIRRAVPTDRASLLRLIESFYRVDGHTFDQDHVLGGLEPLLVDDRYGQIWLAGETAGRPLGYAVVTWSWSLESGGLDCILDEIYVEQRGAGIGGALLDRAMVEAGRHGARVMALETEAPNEDARRFYRRRGFADEDSTWLLTDLGRNE